MSIEVGELIRELLKFDQSLPVMIEWVEDYSRKDNFHYYYIESCKLGENIIFISGPDDESGMFEDLEHLKEFALKTGGYTEEEIEEVFERDSEDIVIISPALGYSGKVANPMTVKELVKRLLTMPQGLEVVVAENLLDFDVKQGYEIERGVYLHVWNKPKDVDNIDCVILKEIYAFYRNSNFTMDFR